MISLQLLKTHLNQFCLTLFITEYNIYIEFLRKEIHHYNRDGTVVHCTRTVRGNMKHLFVRRVYNLFPKDLRKRLKSADSRDQI